MKESLKLSTISLITCCLTLVSCGQNKIVDLPSAPNAIAPSDSAQQVAISKVEEPILKLLLGRWRPLNSRTGSYGDLIFASGGRLYSLFPSRSPNGEALESRYKIDASVNPYVITVTGCNSLDECTDSVANFKLDSDIRMTFTTKGKSVVFERVSRDSELPSGVEILKVTDGGHPAAESQALSHLSAIGKSQMTFYLEKSKFSNNIDELQSSMEREKHYVYEILAVNSGRGSQILLMANHKKLRNFTGLVYNTTSNSDTISVFVLCKSNEPSSEVPKFNFTSNNSNEVQCPSGYSQIK